MSVVVPEGTGYLNLRRNTMADIVTGTVTGQLDVSQILTGHSDIRREQEQIGSDIRRETALEAGDIRRDQAKEAADIRREAAKEASDTRSVSAKQSFDVNDRVGTEADRVIAQDTAYFIAGQSQNFSNATALAALKASTDASFLKTQSDIQLAGMQSAAAATLAGVTSAAAAALEGAKSAAASPLGQALIGAAITADGNTTRALLNSLKIEDLNRSLIERKGELSELKNDLQYSRLAGQINMVHSQVQDTKAGMVNFGTMGASTQSSTSQVA